ncbi:30S ribosomal protein S5 [Candidatus Collierbacteria bacterium]|nr:30S ribosomal protein S5 [Candidatus Collierbacteria bacterium]
MRGNRGGGRPQVGDNYEQVIQIKRVSKKTQGGSLVSFAALVVTGDKKGMVGLGLGKAPNVSDAIKKAVRLANRNLVKIPVVNGTIPYQIKEKYGAAHIILKPAPRGTGIIAGGSIRAIVEAAGVTDIVSKILGTNNKLSNSYATFKALKAVEALAVKHDYLKSFTNSTNSSNKSN